MVISDEIKFPRPVHIDPYRKERKVEATDGITPIARIGAFTQHWNREREGEESPRHPRRQLTPNEESELRHLLTQANTGLEQRHILLRLVLTKDETGYALDVYDCTNDDICQVVGDLVISLDDLPALLRNLEEQSGLLIDTVS